VDRSPAGVGRLQLDGRQGRWVVWPRDRVGVGSVSADPRIAEEFGHYSGISHRPSGTWVQLGWSCAVLVVRPSGAGVINRGSRGEVIDEEVREAEAIASLDDPIDGEGEHACRPAAPPVIVPEPRTDPLRQTGCCDCVPALVCESFPVGVAGDLGQMTNTWASPAAPLRHPRLYRSMMSGRCGGSEWGTRKPSGPASLRRTTSAAPSSASSIRSERSAARPTEASA